jgi:hypothetical protein
MESDMAEIEIRSTGELLLLGEVVGRITWERPFIESDLAGTYDDHGWGYDEFGDPFECSKCEDRADEVEEIEVERDKLIAERDALRDQLADQERKIKKRGIIL